MLVRRAGLGLLVGCVLAALVPTQAQAAPGIRWHKAVRLEPTSDGGVQAVSCASSRLCVAVDASGHALFSTRPGGGNGSWSRAADIDKANPLTGVSCPTTHLCVAVDGNGDVLTSTHPTRGAKGWSRPARIDSVRTTDGGYAGLLAVSCPSTTLCVAVDGATNGHVLTTTHPLQGARAWRMARLGVPLDDVSCASAKLCVVAGDDHIVSTNPAGGRTSWHYAAGPGGGGGDLSGIDCPTTGLCVGVGFGDATTGLADTTPTPDGKASTWHTVDVEASPPSEGSGLLDAVGCAGKRVCVALDSVDNAFVSTNPLHGTWSGPALIRANPNSEQNAISCTTTLCVVVDSAGVETTGAVTG